jgi:lipopolysaccharide export LptBFGC system permease protein LptF
MKSENNILHFNDYDEVKQEIIRPEYFVYEDDYGSVSKIAYADKAIFDSQKGLWILVDGILTHFRNSETKSLIAEPFKSLDTVIEKSPPKIINQEIDSNMLSFRQLYRYMKEAQESGTNIFDRQVDLHMKLSLPFLNLLFIFLIFPFALVRERRKETYLGIVLVLICGFLAWSGNLTLRNFAIRGEINPIFASWFINILLLFIGLFYFRKLDKGI